MAAFLISFVKFKSDVKLAYVSIYLQTEDIHYCSGMLRIFKKISLFSLVYIYFIITYYDLVL